MNASFASLASLASLVSPSRRLVRVAFVASIAASSLTALAGCSAAVSSDPEDTVAFADVEVPEGEVAPADWASGNGRSRRRWSWWYQQAVAAAEARAEDGGTAEAVATAFTESLRRNGKHDEVCAQNAIAVATAVAEATCSDGSKTVARALASVVQC